MLLTVLSILLNFRPAFYVYSVFLFCLMFGRLAKLQEAPGFDEIERFGNLGRRFGKQGVYVNRGVLPAFVRLRWFALRFCF